MAWKPKTPLERKAQADAAKKGEKPFVRKRAKKAVKEFEEINYAPGATWGRRVSYSELGMWEQEWKVAEGTFSGWDKGQLIKLVNGTEKADDKEKVSPADEWAEKWIEKNGTRKRDTTEKEANA